MSPPRALPSVTSVMQIAIVLYPGLTALDAVGPYEILRPLPDAEVRFGAAAGAALVITPALGTYLVAAGLLDHAAWDASGVSSLVHADVASSTWWSSRRGRERPTCWPSSPRPSHPAELPVTRAAPATATPRDGEFRSRHRRRFLTWPKASSREVRRSNGPIRAA
jgi:hypothetical protein